MTMNLLNRVGTLALIGAFALAGCDDSPTDTEPSGPAGIEVNQTAVTLTEVGATTQLAATVVDDNGDEIPGASVTWSSSDESVATVTQQGLVEAVSSGVATVTVTSGSVSEQVSVTVEITPPEPAEVVLTPDALTLVAIGETGQIEATVLDDGGVEIPDAEVTWTSSDEGIVTVSEEGEVEAIAVGSATVTATSGEAAGMVEVTVAVAEEVTVDPAEVTLVAIGATEQLSATVHDSEGAEIPGAAVAWASSDEEIVTVSANGEVEAVAEGTATITATSGNAEGTAEVTVAIPPVPSSVVVEPNEVTLTEIGATEQLSATVLDVDEAEILDAEVTWSSSDAAIVTVSEEGEVEAIAEGVATITATSGEAEGTAEVTVEIAVVEDPVVVE